MTNSGPSLPPRSPSIPSWVLAAFFAASAVGFIDAAYLAAKYYLGSPVTCSILHGCERVTTSAYAVIGGIPVALIGAAYYLSVFLLVAAYYDARRESAILFVSYYTIAGLSASLWFLYLQLFVIQALCLYCLVSATTSIILFLLGMHTLAHTKKTQLSHNRQN